MAGFIDNLRSRYAAATVPMRFVMVNVAVFVIVRLVALVCLLFAIDAMPAIELLEMPSNVSRFVTQPWSLISYMFLHYDVMHILFNMLWLYWFGAMFHQIFGTRRFVGLYFLGGIGGALLYVLAFNLLPLFSGANGLLLGASASVLAIVAATAVRQPDYKIGLLFFGQISLKWIALVTVFIDVISIGSSNAGGHIAHLGGALVGAAFALADRRGIDITAWLNRAIDWLVNLVRRRPRVKVGSYNKSPFTRTNQQPRDDKKPQEDRNNGRRSTMTPAEEAEMDEILKKIKLSGYASLTADEKKRLFDVSKR
ncbi:MAG: rhomboid family intramembrane serine protease [Muribaculaceae bacterium]